MEEKPLLYDYYANTLNPIIDKRNSVDDNERFGKRFFLERPRTVPITNGQDQKFHEIERNDYSDYMKRMLNDDRVMKRYGNLDEIDRFGHFYHTQHTKRNYMSPVMHQIDEIDRFGPEMFHDTKRVEEPTNN